MKLCVACKAIYTDAVEHCYVDGSALQNGAIDGDPLLREGLYAGRYKLTGRIGSGRKGDVYHAWNEYLGHDTSYAVKILHTSVPPETTDWWRFEREAHTLSRCRHENVVEIYDAQLSPQAAYLAMNFVHGQSLSQALRDGPFSLERALRYAMQLACGLSHIHSQAIIHRDLSPANIFLEKQGATDRVKIIDFGLARWPENPLTRSAPRLGEKYYIAPELFKKRGASELSDQYSFGCVLYQMLCGEPPRGSAIVDGLVPPRAIRPRLPEAVEEFVLRTLRHQPDERYPSMKEVIRALDRLVSGRPPHLVVLYDLADRAAMQSLTIALSPYKKEGTLTFWEPWLTTAGEGVAERLEQEIQDADAIAMLSSPDLWNSDKPEPPTIEQPLYHVEQRWLTERVRIIPILVRSARVPAPFHYLAALPLDGRPINHRRDLDDAWRRVAAGLVQALQKPSGSVSSSGAG